MGPLWKIWSPLTSEDTEYTRSISMHFNYFLKIIPAKFPSQSLMQKPASFNKRMEKPALLMDHAVKPAVLCKSCKVLK